VIIPFKAARRKSRLLGTLNPGQREKLSLLMLESVLAAVAGAGLARTCHVVTSDEPALELARRAGGAPVAEKENSGVNAAVSLGMRRVGARRYLILPADLPLLTASDIERAVALTSLSADVVISPSRHLDGTNLLLFSGDRRVPLSYDRNSFWDHISSAARMGCSLAVYTGKGALFDVDTPDDLEVLAGLQISNRTVSFARKVLGQRESS